MKTRLITGFIMLLILLPLVLIDSSVCHILYIILSALMGLTGGYEFVSKAFKDKPNLKLYNILVPLMTMAITAISCISTWKMQENNMYLVLPMLIYVIFVVILLFATIFTKESTGGDMSTLISGLTYSGLMLGLALSIRFLNVANTNTSVLNLNGRGCFLYVYTIVLATDSFAFLFGCKFGKHKLAPSISPKKSVEGAISGLVFGSVLGTVSIYLYNLVDSDKHVFLVIIVGLVISMLISASVQIGDLIESKFKRTYNVKDFGSLLPGHGGILDRFDSFIYSGTIFYIIIMIMEVIIFA